MLSYVREVVSRTEEYWCPIRHAHHVPDAHQRYPGFLAYGDGTAYRESLGKKRSELASHPAPGI